MKLTIIVLLASCLCGCFSIVTTYDNNGKQLGICRDVAFLSLSNGCRGLANDKPIAPYEKVELEAGRSCSPEGCN